MKICWKGDIWKIWVSVSTSPELINLNTNYYGRILPETNPWWVECGNMSIILLVLIPVSVPSGFLILVWWSLACITLHLSLPLTVHSHTNTFMLLPNPLSAPNPSTGTHSPSFLRNDQKNNHYLRNWQLFPLPELYFTLSPPVRKRGSRTLKPPSSWNVPTALGIDMFFWAWINKLGTTNVSSSFTSQSVPPSSSEERLVLDLLAPRGEDAVLSTSLSSKLCRAGDAECSQNTTPQWITAQNNVSKILFQPNE